MPHRSHDRPTGTAPPTTALRRRLAELRGADRAPRPLDARALAALTANPGCERRALLDGAGVDKGALAQALGAPTSFGQSQFAFVRGHAFESRVKGDGGAELIRLLHGTAPEPGETVVPELTADGPAGRAERTRLALAEATTAGVWTLLDHPMVELEVAGSPAYLEPDAVTVAPDGGWTVIEIKSFPILDGAADPAKVGAAARQAAVYALALERLGGTVSDRALLVCPKDFSNVPTAAPMDIRKQLATVRRQLARLTRIEEIAAALPQGTSFDPDRPAGELSAAVESVPAAYAPECLASCELAFHCRERARQAGEVGALGRGVRGELGGLTTVEATLAAARGEAGEGDDPAVAAVRRAARLRAEVLAEVRGGGAA
ncbi:hypothetical protein test1122_07430 [Streptomyces gobiensis]|nr:hypothetical protein [Streptomyces gobiensis]UGY95055.1 hypothetical protein test1122_07430 [Streptomyces gobiensis]